MSKFCLGEETIKLWVEGYLWISLRGIDIATPGEKIELNIKKGWGRDESEVKVIWVIQLDTDA